MTTETELGVDPLALRANKLDLVERVANDLAHEIKNPLHSMVINLEVLKRRIARSDSETAGEMLRYVNVLSSELDRVSHRVELLLRLVRPGRAGDAVPLPEVLDELAELLQLEAGRRSVRIHHERCSIGNKSFVPRSQMLQLLLNLALDVLETLRPGDTLRLEPEPADRALHIGISGVPSVFLPPDDSATAPSAEAQAVEPPAPSGRLPAARLLGAELGGDLQTLAPATGRARYVLCIPASD